MDSLINQCSLKNNISFEQMLKKDIQYCDPSERLSYARFIAQYQNTPYHANKIIKAIGQSSNYLEIHNLYYLLVTMSGGINSITIQNPQIFSNVNSQLPHNITVIPEKHKVVITGRMTIAFREDLKNKMQTPEQKATIDRLYYASQNIKNKVAFDYLTNANNPGCDLEMVRSAAESVIFDLSK